MSFHKFRGKAGFGSSAKPMLTLVGSKALEEKLFNAVFSGNIPEINKYLEKGVSPNAWNNEYGVVPLHLLAERDDILVGSLLITARNLDVNLKNNHGLTALHITCIYDAERFASLLLQNGANPNVLSRHMKTPLHMAVERECVGMVLRLVRSKANVNVLDTFCNSPLSVSIVTVNNLTIAKILFQYGANMSTEDKRPLHIFFETILSCHTLSQIDFIVLLLDNDVDVNLTEENSGRNCLHFVAITGYVELAIVLVEKGAKNDVVDHRNRTPAKAATEHGNDILADYFRKGYRPPRLLKALPLLHLWSNKVKARIERNRMEMEANRRKEIVEFKFGARGSKSSMHEKASLGSESKSKGNLKKGGGSKSNAHLKESGGSKSNVHLKESGGSKSSAHLKESKGSKSDASMKENGGSRSSVSL